MIDPQRVRRLGVVPAPFAGESFLSWVDTLAVTLRLSRAATLQELGLPGSPTFSTSQIHLSPEELGGVCRRTGLRPAQVERILFAFYAPTALPQFTSDMERRWHVRNPWLRRDHSAACPSCLQASGGRWLLSWRLKWTFLCADHLVYLADRCPRCHLWLYWRHEATGPGQREHCTRPLGRHGRGRSRVGAKVCGFRVPEIPAIPVEDEEAVHVQRRVSALLTPADASHNDKSRGLLRDMSGIVQDAARRKTIGGMLDRMENNVVRAVYESQGQPYHPPLAWTLERGSPAALSALVRIAARTLLSDDPTSVPLAGGTAI
ncbi:TniQ family protein [Streptomyces sp. RLB3-17]|uniref:TniQ family protein n=1 Tax=unclassified Streptomyces TaxID=2593676 RepID=UPI0011649FCF|nr:MULTISPECIES: TniQ family protein [unclassified Streptomyces]NMI62413.1 TniQ family protein [Streptomyces sp. RLA2-12]QDN61415.1 TniQ family protein [Streptomyces sp. S1D4-20]QDN71468.1 TniQ family protein [Streptomyces sp. S1D4-14]QDO44009.1 TniQ family protein [Streptomyces sp. RLB3-17]QDO53924.1 TniQ family protein [Streptomyces sp. RLB3-5]